MSSTLARADVQGYVASALGAIAGTLQISGANPALTGNKNDPLTLGVLTLVLAVFMAFGAWLSGRQSSTGHSLAAAAVVGVPALLGLTTAGTAWVAAAFWGLSAAIVCIRDASRQGSVSAVLNDAWQPALLGSLALIYVGLGVILSGALGFIGVLAGVFVAISILVRHRRRGAALALVVIGAVSFAVLSASSLVTPFTALLMLAIGIPMVLSTNKTDDRPIERYSWST